MDTEKCSQLIHKLFQLQEERAHTFKIFEEGYKIYMATAPNYNFPKFRQLVNDATKDFKRISEGIIDIEKQLRFEGLSNVADLIAELQEEEEHRLQLCAKLQIAKQESTDNPDVTDKLNTVATLKEMYNKSIQQVQDKLFSLRIESEDLLI